MWTGLTRLTALGALVMTLPAFASPAWAQDEQAGPTATVEDAKVTIEWNYDADALKDAAEKAEPDDDGIKTAHVWGDITYKYSDGSSFVKTVIFSQSIDGEGVVGSATPTDATYEGFTTNNLWIMIAAMLVFIMHLGFAMVESGLTRAKNTVNILFKNTMIPMIGLTMYAVCGWLIMYPGDNWIVDGWLAFGFGIGGGEKADAAGNSVMYNAGYTVWTDFLFQGMFAATAATIVSGAVAGRIKLLPFLIFSTIFVGISYPVTGSWKWGLGWLDNMGFEDFAGSTLVHAVGGAGALVGAIILGPRLGKYAKDGTVQPIPGHSMPLATIGVFMLWFGWFGFNGGSELSANP